MKLKECCNFIDYRGKTPEKSDEGYRFITAKNVGIDGYHDEPKEYIPRENYEKIMVRGIPNENDILFTTEAPLGHIALIPHFDEPFAIGQRLIVIQPNEMLLNTNYLLFLLRSSSFQNEVIKHSSGSTVKGIRSKELIEIDISFPSLETQKQIAATLDKVTALIDMHKRQLELLEELVKGRFVEMFGNYVFEKDRWNKCLVGDVAITVDPQPSHRTPPVEADGIPYIGIAECDYQTRMIDLDAARKVGNNVLQEHIARYDLHNGDFIIGKIGTIGKPFFLPIERKYALSANTVLIQPNREKIDPYYLFSIFQSEYMDRIIDAEKKSTSQPAFGIQKVRAIEIPLPPLELQTQFAAFVIQTDKSKSSIQQSLAKLETLKKSLMQEYFG